MFKIPLKEGRTIYHDVTGKFGAGLVHLRSAPQGTGVIAGGAMRAIFEVMGIRDIVGKILRSGNPHNVVRATVQALQSVETPRMVSAKRGKKLSELGIGGEK
jgi:small subunit ribosomal protein S5